MKTMRPVKMGRVKFRTNAWLDVLRHANNGPIPVKSKSRSPMGTFTWLKKGAPTVIFSPLTASDKTGKIVPQNTAKQMTRKITLLKRNPLSLDVKDSILFSDFRMGSRTRIRTVQTTRIKAIKPRKTGPRSETANEWTDDMTPLRVRNVPKIQSVNVSRIKIIFHVLSMPFFSWIIMECRKAVPVSQGIKEAFSTGSQAQ